MSRPADRRARMLERRALLAIVATAVFAQVLFVTIDSEPTWLVGLAVAYATMLVRARRAQGRYAGHTRA